MKTCEEIYDTLFGYYMNVMSHDIYKGSVTIETAMRYANIGAVKGTPQAWRDQWKKCGKAQGC